MESNEKKCPKCAETVLAEAVKCKHCGSDLRQKRKLWPWLVGTPVAVLAVMMVVGSNIPPEKSNARDAIALCWKSVDDPLLAPNARLLARDACRSMVADFERKYGPSPSLRRD